MKKTLSIVLSKREITEIWCMLSSEQAIVDASVLLMSGDSKFIVCTNKIIIIEAKKDLHSLKSETAIQRNFLHGTQNHHVVVWSKSTKILIA